MSQICPKCQSTNIDTAKFCKKCGNALQPSAVGGQTLSAIEQRALEEKLYEQVAIELKNGQRKEGLYTKALVDANGVTEQADLLYIKYAVQALSDEITLKMVQEKEFEVNDLYKTLQVESEENEKIKVSKASEEEWSPEAIFIGKILTILLFLGLIVFIVAMVQS